MKERAAGTTLPSVDAVDQWGHTTIKEQIVFGLWGATAGGGGSSVGVKKRRLVSFAIVSIFLAVGVAL